MITKPLKWLEPGTVIDSAWEVEDTYRINTSQKIIVLKRLFDGVQKFMTTQELRSYFGGNGNNK